MAMNITGKLASLRTNFRPNRCLVFLFLECQVCAFRDLDFMRALLFALITIRILIFEKPKMYRIFFEKHGFGRNSIRGHD